MFRPRVIPVLLLRNSGLVKSVSFKKHRYLGDPINAVKIFNEKHADELVFLDILATREKRLIPFDFVRKVGDEANMPFAVGGGIKTVNDIRKILECGAEKVVIGSAACENPEFIRQASDAFGSSTIVVCLDVKKSLFNKYHLVYKNGKKTIIDDIWEFTKRMEEYGAGEIIVQSVDKDGTYKGYDLGLIKTISQSVTVPVVALGGASSFEDFRLAVNESYASAVAASSLFVYHGARKAVLISFPTKSQLHKIFSIY